MKKGTTMEMKKGTTMGERLTCTLKGVAASPGIGVGRPFVLKRGELRGETWSAPREEVDGKTILQGDVEQTLEHWKAVEGALQGQYEELIREAESETVRRVLESQMMILQDPELQASIERAIQVEFLSLPRAICREIGLWADRWASSGADWVEERVTDLLSVQDDLILMLHGGQREYPLTGQTILFADELAPVEMIRIARTSLKGVVLQRAGHTSHAVILAKSLGLPCVVGVDWMGAEPGLHDVALVDGNFGEVLLSPSGSVLKERREKATKLIGWEGSEEQSTRCGVSFVLRANIEYLMEMDRMQHQGARGVGLLRTESMLMSEGVWSLERQVGFYRTVLKKAGNEPVTIRLFDAGGDKGQPDEVSETNPFLGWRGVRMLLDRPDLLQLQLEAILRASGGEPGRVSVMIPMVTFLEEIDCVRSVMRNVMDDLDARGVMFDRNIPFGVMMEVPALVLQAKAVAERVDFMSIGTNDLIQYTLAADRGNERVASHFEPRHPAIWKLVGLLRDASLQTGCSLRVCGEMASEPVYAAAFLGFGVRELSMGVQEVPAVRSHLTEVSIEEAELLAHSLVAADCMREVHATFEAWKKNYLL